MLVEDLGTIAQYQTLPDSGYVTLSINGAVRVDTVAAVQLVPIIKIDGGSSTAECRSRLDAYLGCRLRQCCAWEPKIGGKKLVAKN